MTGIPQGCCRDSRGAPVLGQGSNRGSRGAAGRIKVAGKEGGGRRGGGLGEL